MPTDHRAALTNIKRFDQLIAYLRDEMGWPIARDSFEDVDDLFYDFTAEELGIDPKTAAKIESIKRLRPLSPRQPWGIFFVKFEPKKLPVVALRRILSQVALKKRPSANSAERAAWAADDLLFVSNYGEGDERQITFAHFSKAADGHDLPTLKVLGWNNLDTGLHLDAVATELYRHLRWPDDDADIEAWRQGWRAAFTLRHREAVTTAKELSIRLAELARAIRDRIKAAMAIETERGSLTKLMKAFQEALLHNLDAEGFADMYAQTIAYGLLSARIANPHKKTVDDFAGHMRTNPFLKELMETLFLVGGRRGRAGGPGIDFDELGVSDVVGLLDDPGTHMEAVVRDFGDRNPQEDPVIHFYELFLKEYDAKKRMQRGVFYTPRPVVSYIVRSVDELLRTEFGLADGLADTTTWAEMAERNKDLRVPDGVSPDQAFVQILDPATGTGTFLVEVIDLIHKTLVEKWKTQGHRGEGIEALWNEYVPKHLLPRLHGYEILMAPYAIAHLKVGLKLYETGYRFGSAQRAQIYLTNALEPASDGQLALDFLPALAHEAEAVNKIKRDQVFTVVIGNPPYSKLSANLGAAHRGLVEAFKFIGGQRLRERGALQFEKNLNDDYIKFFALFQKLLLAAPMGALGVITSHTYLDNPTLRGMRWHLLQMFSHLYFLDLHGNVKKIGPTPLAAADENVFDIQQGVAIAVLLRVHSASVAHAVRHADVWGSRSAKYSVLLSTSPMSVPWATVRPAPEHFRFVPEDEARKAEYELGVVITDIFSKRSAGIITARDKFAVQFAVPELLARVRRFCTDPRPLEVVCNELQIPLKKGWDVRRARKHLQKEGELEQYCKAILYRPLDERIVFYHPSTVWSMARPVMREMLAGPNVGIAWTRPMSPTYEFAVLLTKGLLDQCAVGNKSAGAGISYLAPLYLYQEPSDEPTETKSLYSDSSRVLNMEALFVAQVSRALGVRVVTDGRGGWPNTVRGEEILHFIYAQLYSPVYRERYGDFLRRDVPRVFTTRNRPLFRALSDLGSALASLHLMESPSVDHFMATYFGPQKPEVGRVCWLDHTVWLDAASTKRGVPAEPGTIGFRGVPEAVWNFQIGGYQVCEKWLKDREGYALSEDDIVHYQKIVVALNETIRLMKEVDVVIEKHGGWPAAFSTG